MTNPYRNTHELTNAYESLKSTAQALQAHYIALSRQALGDPERQRTYKTDLEKVRDSVSRVNPDNKQEIDTLSASLRNELNRLRHLE
ncbi:hypothetical protein KGD82_27715 (plasmid) [Nocardiopsis eucommiae]|uniref:Uncharacterized protein n=1 Tax=Nocardiopsis eucommiae TaxID=2831970 RepID=A0A975LCW0_9ACTN|nr:hypothetical protein KGD82_27715 [Nocardiopsis eucommiae]